MALICLQELDVSKNSVLTLLACERNQLTELNLNKNTALTYLMCTENEISTLDVSHCPSGMELYADEETEIIR